uniref:Calponin-homology (CH) domain-containing protein n=2 Tax=Panagrolaimus TaxID=55784 RepID=A0A914YAR8_9BILA
MWQYLSPLRAVSDEHEKIQKNTYTRWVNYHLETHSSSGQIRDLFEDLKDGVYLCHLIEVLTGEALPVNKARVSKRVHHVSNLTTALGVLRRRGLELINNNPTDLADGNPRIVLGLIWQMILHFQIETNLNLLREWGYDGSGVQHSTTPSTSAQTTPRKSGSSLLPNVLHRNKTTVDRILLEWIQREIGQKYGLQINDMDKSWRDGLAFMALVHRSNPALVDMEVAKRRTPRENIENAFELARVHLNIRPLLEVDDVLHEKPDKRSIITYVSQFLRAPTSRYSAITTEKIADRYISLIQWIKTIATEPRVKTFIHDKYNLPKDYFAEHQWFTRRRREFLERRVLFNQLRDESHQLPPEEWAKILSEWKSISELLREWSHRLENDLPEPLMNLAQWLSSGEQLVHSSIDINREKAKHSLWALDSMIDNLEKHFKSMPVQKQKLDRAIHDDRVGRELLAPLEVRLQALSDEYKIRRETLLLLRAHYRILVFVEELGKKMDIWKSAESFSALQQWLTEYNKEAEKVPENHLRTLLAEMREVIPAESESLKVESEQSMDEAHTAANEITTQFYEMRKFLEELLQLWKEFESEASKMDTYLIRYEREKRNIDEEIRFLLDRLEAIGDNLGKRTTPSARGTINARLGSYRRRIHDLSRPIGGRLVVNIHPAGPASSSSSKSAPPLPSPQQSLTSGIDELSSISSLKGTRLEQWLISVSQLLRRRAKSAHGATRLCEKLNVSSKYFMLNVTVKIKILF